VYLKNRIGGPFFAFLQRKKNPPDNVPSRYVRNFMPCLFSFNLKSFPFYYYEIILFHLPPPPPFPFSHEKENMQSKCDGCASTVHLSLLFFKDFFPFLFGLNSPSFPTPSPRLNPRPLTYGPPWQSESCLQTLDP